MLFDVPYKQGDAVTLKLNSGEEIIARFEEESNNGTKISKPMSLTATAEGMGLAPYIFTVPADASLVIRNTAIVCVSKTETQMAKQYLQNTTGLSL